MKAPKGRAGYYLECRAGDKIIVKVIIIDRVQLRRSLHTEIFETDGVFHRCIPVNRAKVKQVN